MRAFLPCVQEAAHPGVVGRCFPSSSVSEEPLPPPCPAPTTCWCTKDSPVCTAPRWKNPQETMMSVRLAFLWDPRASPGDKVCCWADCSLPGYLGGDKRPDLSPPWTPLTNTFAGSMAFCCWTWALLTPGHWGQEEPWALEVWRSVLQHQGGHLEWVLEAGECRGHWAICFSHSSSLARRALRTNHTTPGGFAEFHPAPAMVVSIQKLPSACLCGPWSRQDGWSPREWQWIPTYTNSIWWAGIGIDLTWPLTLIVWACRLPPLPAQGKEDACPLSHISFPPAFFLHQLQGTSWQHPHGRCCIGQCWFLKLGEKDPPSAGLENDGLSVLTWPPVAVLLENQYWK